MCNVDAALFNEEQQFGMGMCIRGAHGTYVKARTMVFEGTSPPLEAEAYALKKTLIWLEELGISRVDIELDCMLVVNAINEKSRDSAQFGAIVKQCRLLLDNHPNFKISFIRRQANFVAHILTRASKSYASRQTFGLIPFFFVPIWMNEVICVCFCQKKKKKLHYF
jgi:ribonuclease HI